MHVRLATEADVPAVAETVALAFAADPVWAPVLRRADGSTDHLIPFWTPFVEGALLHDTVWIADDGASAAVWIPPGGDEMTDEQFARVQAIVDEVLSPEQRSAFDVLMQRFEEHHPHDAPHWYLSLLATHPSRRGEGLAQQMLAGNVRDFAQSGLAAYLESTNPVNDRRYERAGFRAVGGFTSPLDDAAPITTMWRPVDA
ncbi:GNAT family N-acetyltransferase [Agromyces allii]|uniref:GNAT family N-acetyltransferase n=1 Tax=Agromyces allii TaxID=393607 RepID=A0ABP5CBF1_9MICO|nr:GNAT family N-acetyltransferase [Agromyces allii]